MTAAGIAKLAILENDGDDACDSDTEQVDDDDDDPHGSYPHSPTPDNDRPSTITEEFN